MVSSVLNSNRAIEVNIAIMRAFVKLRDMLAAHKDLARKLEDIERKLGHHITKALGRPDKAPVNRRGILPNQTRPW
jgi:hypothetical protein